MRGGFIYALEFSADESLIYIGGAFTAVGGQSQSYFATVKTSDGGVVNAFMPQLNSPVEALALSLDSSRLYVGGDFTLLGGVARNHLAAIDLSNESLTSFNPDVNGLINDMELSSDGNTLYLGGRFSTVGGQSRTLLAAVNTSDGSLLSGFNVNITGFSIETLSLSSDNNTLYIGGSFSDVDGLSRSNIAAIKTSDGSVVTTFNPNANLSVNSLELTADGSTLYVGGLFSIIGGVARSHIAALNTSNGQIVSSFNPGSNGEVMALELSADESFLYLGGSFSTVGGQTMNRVAKVKTSDGSLLPLTVGNLDSSVLTFSLSPDGQTLYMGGGFSFIGTSIESNLTFIDF